MKASLGLEPSKPRVLHCSKHESDKIGPLIPTDVWEGWDYWCPLCGKRYNSKVDKIPSLLVEPGILNWYEECLEMAKPYLEALGRYMKGTRISKEQRQKDRSIIWNWKYKY